MRVKEIAKSSGQWELVAGNRRAVHQLPHVLCRAGALLKGCFASASAVKGRLHRALSPIAARRSCHVDEAK